jgi:hypothetical protein
MYQQRNRDRRAKRGEADGVAGAHVHQEEEEQEEEVDEIRALVLAAVADNGIIHENAFEPISTREEFEDEDIGEVACIIVGDHYYPSEDEGMNTGDTSSSDESDPRYCNRPDRRTRRLQL